MEQPIKSISAEVRKIGAPREIQAPDQLVRSQLLYTDLGSIKPMCELYQSLAGKVDVLHVNGHVGVEGNDLPDGIPILAIDERYTKVDSVMIRS